MTLKFNPPRQITRYAVFVDHGNGRGSFKPFNDLGSAKNSWLYATDASYTDSRYDAKILENIDGNWYVLYDVPKGTHRDNRPWAKDVEVGGWHNARIVRRSVPMSKEDYADFRVKVAREQWEAERFSKEEELMTQVREL